MSGNIYVVSAARTPIGAHLGALGSVKAPKLGEVAIRGALQRAGLAAESVEEVYLGNVLSAGIGQAPARQASLFAGLPQSAPATTVSKVCGSGLQAVVLGARSILAKDAECVVAGGMESMSNVPYYLPHARTGYRMGDAKLVDGMLQDGLMDPYKGFHMGQAGELCAREYKISRARQDEYATRSYELARKSVESGAFMAEIEPVSVPQKKGAAVVVDKDEEPFRGDPSRFSSLKPVFDEAGTITAANASSISDGAAALLLASEEFVSKHSLQPLARLVGWGAAAQAPEWFTTAPAAAIERTLSKLNLTQSDIDFWEINEAFSCVALVCTDMARVDPERVNVRGGAVALGHPIGASGARILTTLLYVLAQEKARRGLATLCIGGGEAVAVVVERV